MQKTFIENKITKIFDKLVYSLCTFSLHGWIAKNLHEFLFAIVQTISKVIKGITKALLKLRMNLANLVQGFGKFCKTLVVYREKLKLFFTICVLLLKEN